MADLNEKVILLQKNNAALKSKVCSFKFAQSSVIF